MRRIGIFVLLGLVGCSGTGSVTLDGSGSMADELTVSVLLAPDGLAVLGAAPAAGLTLPRETEGGLLRYELRDSSGTTLSSGLVYDPRVARSESIDNGMFEATLVNTGRGAVDVRLTRHAGTIVILEDSGLGWREIARTAFDPEASAQPRNALLQQPADVVGAPVKLVDHGDPAVKLDMLFLPEGYTDAEFDKFHADVQTSIDRMSSLPDYAPYWVYFNIWRQDVRSHESGLDDPSQNIVRDTAFDVSFGTGGVQRCTFPSTNEGHAAILALGKQANADFVVVLVNSDTYGGCSGGTFVTQTRNSWGGDILAHELGHSLYHLADEYDYGTCATKYTGINVAQSAKLSELPWADLVNTEELPTAVATATAGTVGAFEGAAYCTTGMYRPQTNCMMRELGSPLCAVCKRAMKSFFDAMGAKGGGTCTGSSCAPPTSTTTPPADDPTCPQSWRGDGLCDPCLGNDPDCNSGCPTTWWNDGWCDSCIRNDPDCGVH